MSPALEELAQGSVGPGAEQAALAVTASTTWVAIRASPSAWPAPGLVALEEGAAAVSVALGVATEVVMEGALVVAEEWEVVLEELVALEGLVALEELVVLVGLVALEELVALVDLVVLVDLVALALVALVQVASLGESRK